MEPKKLYRSATNKMICGVCQGIAEYINLDPTIVRLLWVLFSLSGGAIVLPIVKTDFSFFLVRSSFLLISKF